MMVVAEQSLRAKHQLQTSDQALVESIAERHEGAFESLVRAYQSRLYGLAWRITGDRQDAEEAVQDSFMKAYQALFSTYSVERVRTLYLRPWLFAVTLNAARNRRRARGAGAARVVSDLEGGFPEPVAKEPEPAEIVESGELSASLEGALGELPLRYRAAVLLRMVEGLSYDEASRALGRPIGTVKSDVHRGLRLLRQRLGARLEDESER